MAKSYEERQNLPAGRGLFTTKEVKAYSVILQDKAPFVGVLDSPYLTRACSWCFILPEESSEEDSIKVSACTGCKILRYCGKVRTHQISYGACLQVAKPASRIIC
jgi:hypothetical protein